MLDAFQFPGNSSADVQQFTAAGSTASWQFWEKPRGCAQVFIAAVGAGGGGGGGFTRVAGNAGGGGAGGGGAAFSRLLIPAIFIPDRLWIQVGFGGAGGTGSGVAGTAGAASNITTRNNNLTAPDSLLLAPGGTAGAAGTAAGGGASGGLASGSALTSGIMAMMGISLYGNGTNSGAGGAHTGAIGASTTWGTNITCGGAGGGGCQSADFAGGAVTGQGWMNTVAGGTASLKDGGAGTMLVPPMYPFCSCGGSGGAALNNAAGGRGGDGAIGSGGGGGGAGTTGGAGGRGGNGLIVIIAW